MRYDSLDNVMSMCFISGVTKGVKTQMNDVKRNGHSRVNQLKSNDHVRREKKLFPITMNKHL